MSIIFLDWKEIEDLAVRCQSLSKYGRKAPPRWVMEKHVRLLANAALFASLALKPKKKRRPKKQSCAEAKGEKS